MALAPAQDPATLRIKYETDQLLPAADVATILREVATGFERHAKRNRRYAGLRLAITRVEVSSLLAELVVVGVATAQAVILHRQAIQDFVGFVADTMSIAQGLKRGKVKAADTKMVEAIQKPVAEAGAVQLNINVVGDHNTIVIDREAIQRYYAERERAAVSKAGQQLMRAPASDAYSDADRPPRLLTLDGKYGTAHDVKGRWFVQLEGEGGVLNPLYLEGDVTVRDGQAYQFDGVWDDRRYRIRAARPLPV